MAIITDIDKRYFLMTNTASKPPKEGMNDIAICCPICGEGKSWNRKQRLHLYIKPTMDDAVIHCFNCDFSGKMRKYLEQVDEGLMHQYINETKTEKFNNLDVAFTISQDKLRSKSEIKIIKLSDFGFIKATDSKKAMSYLYKRCLSTDKFKEFYYAENSTFTFNGKEHKLYSGIISPLWYNRSKGEIYGFQYRSIEGKQFLTFLPPENQGYKIYNYFESKRDKLYVFESVFDLMSVDFPFENKIAILGSDLPDKILDETKEIILVLDNTLTDETSKRKIEKYCKKYNNIKVFIWPSSMRNFKDFNSILQDANSKGFKKTESKLSKIISLNIFSGTEALVKLFFT
jgi:hypothetical protein